MTPTTLFTVGVRLIGVWLIAQATVAVPALLQRVARSREDSSGLGAFVSTLVVQAGLGTLFILIPSLMDWTPKAFDSSDTPRQRDTK